MKIKNITLTVERTQGKPLVYAINPWTVGAANFALVRGCVAGWIEAEQLTHNKKCPRGTKMHA